MMNENLMKELKVMKKYDAEKIQEIFEKYGFSVEDFENLRAIKFLVQDSHTNNFFSVFCIISSQELTIFCRQERINIDAKLNEIARQMHNAYI